MRRRQVIAAALAVGLAGCTGDSDGSDPNTDGGQDRTEDANGTEPGGTDTATPTDTPSPTGTSTPREETVEVPGVPGTETPALGDAGGETTEGSSVDSGNDRVDEFLSGALNYDGIEDHTGESAVTVDVGVETSTDPYAFGPAAIRIAQGTTVTWEWTGKGGYHDVKANEGADFKSELTGTEGHTFEHTFSESGTVLYVCTPHQGMGMKGAVVVE